MKISSLILASLIFYHTNLLAATNLNDAFKAALQNNENYQLSQSKTKQLDEKVTQSEASFQPKLNLIGAYTRLGLPEASKNPDYDKQSHSLRFNATHPLFRGFKDLATLKGAEYDKLSQKEQEEYVRLNLYSTVAQSYFSIIAYEGDLKNLAEQESLLTSRVKELKERVLLGKSRKADLLSAQAQLASTKSQIESTKAQLEITRESFANITGLKAETVLDTPANELPTAKEINYYLTKIDQRPDIKSLQRQVKSSSELTKATKGSRLPSVDLNGNYYVDRSGKPKPSQWDVGVTITLPLYEGGVISSQVREALEKQNEKNLLLDQARKNAEKEIKVAYETFLSNQKQLEALSESITSFYAAYQEHLKDYRYGMSTLLDVLQAQTNYLDSKKSYDRMKSQTNLAWNQLLVSSADENIQK